MMGAVGFMSMANTPADEKLFQMSLKEMAKVAKNSLAQTGWGNIARSASIAFMAYFMIGSLIALIEAIIYYIDEMP
jgi:hypothetical protein